MAIALQKRMMKRAAAHGLTELSDFGERLGLGQSRRRKGSVRLLTGAIPVAAAIVAAGVFAAWRRPAQKGVATKPSPYGSSPTRKIQPNQASPAHNVTLDAQAAQAPDPRRHYPSPEDLREDIELDLATRRHLMAQWKDEVDREIEAGAEGMAFADDRATAVEAGLAGEARRVSKALAALDREMSAV